MRVGVLTFQSRQFQNYSHADAIFEAAQKYGHEVDIIDAASLTITFDSGRPTILTSGKPLKKYQIIFSRPRVQGDPSIPVSILRLLEATGAYVVNSADGMLAGKNKVESLARLSAKKVPIIRSTVAYTVDEAVRAARRERFPVVVKVPYGSHGTGVFLAQDEKTLRPIVDFLISRGYDDPVLIQKYIVDVMHDVRAFVIGGKVIAAAERLIAKGDFRSNQKQGAVMNEIELTKVQERVAINAAKAAGIEIAGVDLLLTKRGTKVVEVNANPQFAALTAATGVDVAGAMVQYAVRAAVKR